MNLANLLPVGIATLTAVALALPNLKAQSPQTTPQPTLTQPTPAQTSPRRLTIKVSVAEPSDLKVKEGDRIKTGQLIADRSRERSRITSQKQQLTISLHLLIATHAFNKDLSVVTENVREFVRIPNLKVENWL